MIYITQVRMSGGTSHQHIAAVRWTSATDGNTGESTTAVMVSWIRDDKGDARVKDAQGEVRVGVVDGTPSYLRTFADGRWTDNLLSLPRY